MCQTGDNQTSIVSWNLQKFYQQKKLKTKIYFFGIGKSVNFLFEVC